jgi:hypothetical protein
MPKIHYILPHFSLDTTRLPADPPIHPRAHSQAEEMSKLESEFARHEAHMGDMQRSLAAEQSAHQAMVAELGACVRGQMARDK